MQKQTYGKKSKPRDAARPKTEKRESERRYSAALLTLIHERGPVSFRQIMDELDVDEGWGGRTVQVAMRAGWVTWANAGRPRVYCLTSRGRKAATR